MNDYYSILHITKQASQEEIKQAYKKLALKYHPDKQNGDTKQFQQIQEAYDTLGDPMKRKTYDNQQLPKTSTSFGFNSFFNYHFNQKTVKRADCIYKCRITLEDVYYGTIKKIKVKRNILCNMCINICEICNGKGGTTIQHSFGPLIQVSEKICNECKGNGWKSTGNCNCIDNKKLEEKIFEIEIVPGIENGKVFKFAEWGEQSNKMSELPGDLVIIIDIEAHKYFKRHNLDLIYNMDISLKDVIIGKKIDIQLFDENLEIDSSGFGIINPNKQYIIYNKGIRNDKNEIGNLLLRFNIIFPELVLNQDEKSVLIEAFNRTAFKHL